MAINFNKIQIDEELEELLPALSEEDYKALEDSLLKNGFNAQFGRIMVWFPENQDVNSDCAGYIVDGHNRYKICKKHNIELFNWCYETIFFESKEDVIKWMYENQLARRNLSDGDKYEIVERYSDFLNERAKKNQSDGGKGLSNMTTVNVRKEKAKKVGISEGSYYKLDKVMQSDNQEVKQKLKEKKISIDGAYKTIKNPVPKKKEEQTPQIQIEKLDNRMNEIDKEASILRTEREALMRRRTSLFEALDVECELKCEFVEEDLLGFSRDCRFFIEIDGHREIFVESGVYVDEVPFGLYINKVPEKYKNDFIMLWKKAHLEEIERINRYNAEQDKEYERMDANPIVTEGNKDFYKKCFRLLAKNFHPDNEDGNMEDMQCLNEIKIMWGI